MIRKGTLYQTTAGIAVLLVAGYLLLLAGVNALVMAVMLVVSIVAVGTYRSRSANNQAPSAMEWVKIVARTTFLLALVGALAVAGIYLLNAYEFFRVIAVFGLLSLLIPKLRHVLGW